MPWRTRALLASAVTAAALLAAGCGGTSPSAGDARVTAAPAKATASAARSQNPPPTPPPTATAGATIDPGTLPQTHVLPSGHDARFLAGAQALWQAIVQDKPGLAQSFFFPLTAYRQVKAISNPDEDYRNRLIAWYDLDIRAAHDHLGPAAATARFISMNVPGSNAEWIEPGVEYNKGSYYRVYGTRLDYEVDGNSASIGVFSLISWRGEWYVVHLGPSTRSAPEGIVYDPWN